jgi:hypothetical protein
VVWLYPARFGRILSNLADWGLAPANPANFWKSDVGRPYAFALPTWQPMTGPRGGLSLAHITTSCTVTATSSCSISLPHHLTGGCMVCHVVVRTATWHLFIGPRIFPKSPKMSDTWQPLVLPHHHVDISMTHVTLCVCHIYCTDDDIIHTGVDVSSTDVDSSLLTGLG